MLLKPETVWEKDTISPVLQKKKYMFKIYHIYTLNQSFKPQMIIKKSTNQKQI